MPPPASPAEETQERVYRILTAHVRGVQQGDVTTDGRTVVLSRLMQEPLGDGCVVHAKVAADLCVEVKSPSDAPRTTQPKVREHFANGVRMVWLVHLEARNLIVYRKPGRGEVLWEDATITGEDVLPGFTCPVAEFFSEL